ncbi:LOW QUALITY PROTEIN: uncharacterized protein TA06485 [Theileria annulata]|uniref:Uncharacterized protein n=1 Tax=Theileria annulata TaxID=5874 RepID=Q4UIC7_THEAN|nr:LOW QUALITY PROTEIN: uncharacterized protein TA06485 [Theileria annulata]CAI73162.1 hypothetical protein, conserved [Theileria annulata]|eukprot:XP_953840.1 LOW QUALITY PROTEIN: hypothetical protein, conserved [Theileria annulata]
MRGFNRIFSIGSIINYQRRFLTELPYNIDNKNLYCNSFASCEDVTKYIEFLSIGESNEVDKISDSTHLFNERAHKMYPYQIIRVLNSYARLKFSNENILKSVLTRCEEMCDQASPKRALELITLYRNVNLSHEQVLSPLTKSLINHMNNYSYELYTLGLNASYLNITDQIFIESLKTQILLTSKELNPLNSIKNLESFSRFRVESDELFDSVWNFVKDKVLFFSSWRQLQEYINKNLNYSRRLLEFHIDLLSSELEKSNMNSEEISTILTIKSSKGYFIHIIFKLRIVHHQCVEAIINSIEMKVNDPNYIKDDIYYHIFKLSQILSFDETDSLFKSSHICEFWKLILDKIFTNITGFLSPTKAIQLLYTISILKRNNVIDKNYDEILKYIKPIWQKLNLRDQELLYDSLVSMYWSNESKGEEDIFVKRIIEEKMPTILPLMYGNMKNVKLGIKGGKNVIYKADMDKKLVPQKCVNEFYVLNVVNEGVKVVKSPETLMELEVMEKIHNDVESYTNRVEIKIPNEKLKMSLKC